MMSYMYIITVLAFMHTLYHIFIVLVFSRQFSCAMCVDAYFLKKPSFQKHPMRW